MIDSVYCLTSLFFFDIPFLYFYINFRSSIIFCLFSGDIYLSFGISVSHSTLSDVFYGEFIETSVILSAILLPIKPSVASAVFLISFL